MKRKKKILFIMGGLVHYYNPILQAINSFEGYELQTLTPETGSTGYLGEGVHQEIGEYGFVNHFLPEKKGLFRKSFFGGFTRFIKKNKPDIIICGWPYILEIALNPFLQPYLEGVKLINKDIPFNLPPYHNAMAEFNSGNIIISEDYDKSDHAGFFQKLNFWLVTELRKLYLNKADAHVCYTSEAFEVFGSYGVEAKKIFIIYNSPDTKKLIKASEEAKAQPALLPYNPGRFIHVGRLVKWKKVDLLIRAVSQLIKKFPATELLVIGKGPETENLKKLAEELHVSGHIKFLGAIYDPVQLAAYHHSSGAYVLGGIGGLSINEAMSFAKPVICSVCDGTEKMLVKDGDNGYFFKNDNLEDLTLKLENILSHPETLEQMGQRSLQIIQEEINEDRVVKGYAEALSYVKSLEEVR